MTEKPNPKKQLMLMANENPSEILCIIKAGKQLMVEINFDHPASALELLYYLELKTKSLINKIIDKNGELNG